MNSNTRKTLTGLQMLGLNLDTGRSPAIYVNNLESVTGLRQVGNGSKIIRRDNEVFSKFKYVTHLSEDNEILSYEFQGYKSSNDLVSEMSKDLLRIKSKISSLEDQYISTQDNIQDILSKAYFEYSKEDLL